MKVLFTGSFNPFHHGHQYVYDTACKMFGIENVWLGIGQNPDKPEREFDRLRYSLTPITNNVITFTTLTAKVVEDHGFDFIIRGVKGASSLHQEEIQAYWNGYLGNGVQTILIPTPPEISMISSSVIRELVSYNAVFDISHLMSLDVYYRWKQKTHEHTVYFGKSCSGKSTLCYNVLDVDKVIWDFVDHPDKDNIRRDMMNAFIDKNRSKYNVALYKIGSSINWYNLFGSNLSIDAAVIGVYWDSIPMDLKGKCRFVKVYTSEENRKEFIKKRNVSQQFIESADFFYQDPPYWDNELEVRI